MKQLVAKPDAYFVTLADGKAYGPGAAEDITGPAVAEAKKKLTSVLPPATALALFENDNRTLSAFRLDRAHGLPARFGHMSDLEAFVARCVEKGDPKAGLVHNLLGVLVRLSGKKVVDPMQDLVGPDCRLY